MGRKEAYRKGTFLKVFHRSNDLDCFEAEEKRFKRKRDIGPCIILPSFSI